LTSAGSAAAFLGGRAVALFVDFCFGGIRLVVKLFKGLALKIFKDQTLKLF
jgi:hypothetical protein